MMQDKINFIQSISEQRQKEYRRWFLFSCVFLVVVLIAISFFQTKQLVGFTQAKQAFTARLIPDESIFLKQKQLKQEWDELQQKQQNLQQGAKNLERVQQMLVRVNSLQQYGPLEMIQLKPDKTMVTLSIARFENVQQLLQDAQQKADMRIMSVEPKQHQYAVQLELF